MVKFTHLHTHTPEGSLLDGFMRIDKAIEKAKRLGMDSIGVSEHGTMASHKIFNDKMKEAGLHPVFGMEAYQTVEKSYTKEDFEGVDYIEDENGVMVFKFMSEDEVDKSQWMLVDDITPKKEMKRIEQKSKDEGALVYNLVKDSLLEGEEMPKSRGGVTRRANKLIKQYTKRDEHLYVKADMQRKEYFEWFPHIGHLLLIALNNDGYQNLLTLNAIGFKDGFYGKPRIDYSDLEKYGKGLAATTACLGGFIPQLILRGRIDEAREEILRTKEYFDEYFLEIQPSRQEDQHIVNAQLIKFSEELDIPLIATSDVHMVDRDELHLHEQITNIGMGGAGDTSAFDSDISVYDSAYMMEPQEMLDLGIPEIALQNAYDLSHRCQVDFLEDTTLKFPEYEIPEGYTFDSYLREKVNEGLFDLFLTKDYIKDYDEYHARIEYELDIIKQKGYSAYFLIVQDYMNWAREAGIMTGPGRGSASGSLVSYVLGIITVDPIRHGLLFERYTAFVKIFEFMGPLSIGNY